MNSSLNYILFFCLLFISQNAITQRVVEEHSSTIESKNSLNFELLGRGFLFGSFNYEYTLAKRLSLGLGLGFANVQRGQISRLDPVGNVSETGMFFEAATTQMIYTNYFLGKNKHKLILTAGITNFLLYDRQNYPSELISDTDSFLNWNIGIGYQLSLKKVKFRITAYAINLPGESIYLPGVLPWVGFAVCKNLRRNNRD